MDRYTPPFPALTSEAGRTVGRRFGPFQILYRRQAMGPPQHGSPRYQDLAGSLSRTAGSSTVCSLSTGFLVFLNTRMIRSDDIIELFSSVIKPHVPIPSVVHQSLSVSTPDSGCATLGNAAPRDSRPRGHYERDQCCPQCWTDSGNVHVGRSSAVVRTSDQPDFAFP